MTWILVQYSDSEDEWIRFAVVSFYTYDAEITTVLKELKAVAEYGGYEVAVR